MDVRSALVRCGLTDAHFSALAEAVPEGYLALKKLVESTPMLRQFVPGMKSTCYLRNVAVQHALQLKAGDTGLFYTRDASFAGNGQAYLQLQSGRVIITSQYCGPRGNRGVRKAVARAALCARTDDLFAAENDTPDMNMAMMSAYAQLMHGGVDKPVFAALRIPNKSQAPSSLTPMLLELVTPNASKVEEVADRLREQMRPKKKTKDKDDKADAG
jgi:hypothetical protein